MPSSRLSGFLQVLISLASKIRLLRRFVLVHEVFEDSQEMVWPNNNVTRLKARKSLYLKRRHRILKSNSLGCLKTHSSFLNVVAFSLPPPPPPPPPPFRFPSVLGDFYLLLALSSRGNKYWFWAIFVCSPMIARISSD